MITPDVKLGKNVKIWQPELVNLYGCTIGDNCKIGAFVEIGKGVKIGNRVSVGAFSFIPEGVTIEDNVFIAPGFRGINDKFPPSGKKDWKPTLIKESASIGAGAIIMCGVTIGKNARIGAGSVVTKDIPDGTLAYGNPAKVVSK